MDIKAMQINYNGLLLSINIVYFKTNMRLSISK